MKLSVIVPTYNRQDDLVDCLESLRRQFQPPEEIIIVDDGVVTETRERLREENLSNVTHVEGKSNGLPSARNRGVEAATGDVIAFVDDDVVLPPDWSRQLLGTYERFPDAAGVGGYVLNYNPPDINKANVDSLGYRLLQAFRTVFLHDRVGDISPVGILYAPHVFMTSAPRRTESLQGCNMSFRAEVFDTYSFDEWYGTSSSSAIEEVDFAYRVSNDGADLIYNPELVVIHKRSLGGEADARNGGPNYGSTTNLTYFLFKHPGFSAGNLLLLIFAVAVYSLLTRNFGHLRAVTNGMTEYWKQRPNLSSQSSPNSGESND